MANLNAGKGPQRSADAPDATAQMQPLTDAVAECGELCSKGFATWQDEVSRFAQTRMQRNSALAEAAGRCRDLGDFVALQQEWLKAAGQDYAQQTARMMGVATRLTQDWMQPVTRLWGAAAAAATTAAPKPKE